MGSEGPGEFATRLRRLRQAASLSQEELAERSGLTAKAVGALERGERRRPYPNTVRALADALGLDEQARSDLADAAQGRSAPPAAAPGIGPASIPVPPTPIIGRDRDLAEVVALLRSGTVRLVTLTGPGGVGKTRLALEVAAALHREGGADPAMAELVAVTTVDLVVPTVARALGLQAATGDVAAAIARFLGDRRQVLVLDNLEHVPDIAPVIAELLSRCPGLVVLATSRAPLRIRAEHDHPVAPLPLPQDTDLRAITWSPAVQLFVDRARAVAPRFSLDRHNAAAVAAICRQLDGWPLALELAATHIRYLTPAQLLARLDTALDSAGLRDLPERQRTMGATLDWSYQLLTGEEQRLLRGLSVFRGGFDLDAVEAMFDADHGAVLAVLHGLIDQSFVSPAGGTGPHGPARYRLLEPVRLYARSLVDPQEAAELADRHARHHCALAQEARAGLRGPDLGMWLDRLAHTHADLRATLDTLVESGQLDAAARLGSDTWPYWAVRGHAGEGLRWWGRVLERAGEHGLDRHGRAAVRVALAGLRLATGDIAAVEALASTAVADARVTGDRPLVTEALNLWCVGSVFTGDLAAAGGRIEELLAESASIDQPWAVAHARTVEAQLLLLRGEPTAAALALDAAEDTARAAALPFTLAMVLNMQATVALHVGDDHTALRCLVESAELAAEVGTTWTLVYSLPALAGMAARTGEPVLAVTLFAAGSATAEATLLAVSFRPDAEAADAQLDALRRQLPEEEFRRAWAHGRALRIDEVVELIPRISVRRAPA